MVIFPGHGNCLATEGLPLKADTVRSCWHGEFVPHPDALSITSRALHALLGDNLYFGSDIGQAIK